MKRQINSAESDPTLCRLQIGLPAEASAQAGDPAQRGEAATKANGVGTRSTASALSASEASLWTRWNASLPRDHVQNSRGSRRFWEVLIDCKSALRRGRHFGKGSAPASGAPVGLSAVSAQAGASPTGTKPRTRTVFGERAKHHGRGACAP